MLKRPMMASAVIALMIGGAMAQTSPGMPQQSAPKSAPSASLDSSGGEAKIINSQKPEQWLASKFKGTNVVGADNKTIGSVSDILFDKDGKIEAYVVSVGGFLGMGAKEVALAPSSFQVLREKNGGATDRLKLSMTQDQLKQAANFEPYQPPRPVTTGSGGPGAPRGPAPRTNTAPGSGSQ